MEPDVEHFYSIPWCAALLREDAMVVERPTSRILKASREDALLASTLNTADAISAYVVFHKRQQPGTPDAEISRMHALLAIGEGLNGFPQVCHGGIVATMMDEVMGSLIQLRAGGVSSPLMTAYLNTTYLKPVTTPSTVLVTVEVTRQEGRKLFMTAVIQDQHRQSLAKAEALFVALKQRL